ncbi:MAG: ATP-binding cassette domain-containing protein [Rickettsiaceae bacterium]
MRQDISVRNLYKHYGSIQAIDDLSFFVESGEIVGFLGPNGAGKSTTMRILCGLCSANAGCVDVCGVSVARYPEKASEYIGFMPENNPLPEDMRVREYLNYRGHLKGLDKHRRKKRVNEVMEVCDLERTAKNKMIHALSKGFRQRIGVADALLGEPKIVIMDEPTIGLDPHQILSMRRLFDQLRGQMTIVISSHILHEIETTCDRAIIINHGKIVASGTTRELKQQFFPEARYVISVRGPINVFEDLLRSFPDAPIAIERQKQDSNGFYDLEVVTISSIPIAAVLIRSISVHPELELRSFEQKQPHLEDVFLAATKPSWSQSSTVRVLNKNNE